jgi:hypothetical protein
MSNEVITLACTGMMGHRYGARLHAWFNKPIGVTVDMQENLILSDTSNHCIRMIDPSPGGGYEDGKGLHTQFHNPMGIALDAEGNLLVADSSNHRIRKVTPQGRVTTLAGTGEPGHRDGRADRACFNFPIGLDVERNCG